MCRWLAYSGCAGAAGGPAVQAQELAGRAEPALPARVPRPRTATASGSAGTATGETPGVFRSTEPAWNDRNLRELAGAHHAPRACSRTSARRRAPRSSRRTATRSATGAGCSCTTATSTACPASGATWRWRSTPSLFPDIEGTTDTELLFYLVPDLRARRTTRRRPSPARSVSSRRPAGGTASSIPIQMTVVTTDGETTWAFRYSSEGRSRSLFHSTDVSTLRAPVPGQPDAARALRRRPPHRLRAAGRSARRLARGARVHLRDDPRRGTRS